MNYLTVTMWDSCEAFQEWRGGPDFDAWLGGSQGSELLDTTCSEGVLPVWPALGRAVTADGRSLKAPTGWREVSVDEPLPTDAFISLNRIFLEPPGYEAYFEKWAVDEGAARLRYEKHVSDFNKASVRWSPANPSFRGHLMVRRPSATNKERGHEYTSLDVWKDKDAYIEFLHWDAFDKTKTRRDAIKEFGAAEAAGESSFYEALLVLDASVQHAGSRYAHLGDSCADGEERRRRRLLSAEPLGRPRSPSRGSRALAPFELANGGCLIGPCASELTWWEEWSQKLQRPFERAADGDAPFQLAAGSCLIGPCASEQAWWAEWSERLTCWWEHTPYQAGLQACFGALGVTLARRFEQFTRLRGGGVPGGELNGAAEPSCEWVGDVKSRLELPDFPSLGDGVEFTLPPIPRLLPSWQQEHSRTPGAHEELRTFASVPRSDHSATATAASATVKPVDALYVGIGASVGALAGVIVVFGLRSRRMQSRQTRSGGVSVDLAVSQGHVSA